MRPVGGRQFRATPLLLSTFRTSCRLFRTDRSKSKNFSNSSWRPSSDPGSLRRGGAGWTLPDVSETFFVLWPPSELCCFPPSLNFSQSIGPLLAEVSNQSLFFDPVSNFCCFSMLLVRLELLNWCLAANLRPLLKAAKVVQSSSLAKMESAIFFLEKVSRWRTSAFAANATAPVASVAASAIVKCINSCLLVCNLED